MARNIIYLFHDFSFIKNNSHFPLSNRIKLKRRISFIKVYIDIAFIWVWKYVFFSFWIRSPWEMKLVLLLNILDPFYGSHIDSTLSHIHLHYIQCISCDTFNLNPLFVLRYKFLGQTKGLYFIHGKQTRTNSIEQ